MTYGTPLWLDNGSSYPAGIDRQLIAAAFPDPGVFGVTELAVSQRAAGADSSVDVADGRAVIYEQGTTIRAYLVRLFAGPQNVPLPASPASNSRYDMIYAQVRDSTIAGADNDWLLTVVSGATAVSPVEPAAPSGQSLLLARVLRTAGTATVLNAAIQDRRVFTRNAYPLPWVTITAIAGGKAQGNPLRVRHRDDQHVEIAGSVADTSGGMNSNDTLFTLPSPSNQPSFFPTRTARAVCASNSVGLSGQEEIRVEILTSGVAMVIFSQPSPSGSPTYAPDDVWLDFTYLRVTPT